MKNEVQSAEEFFSSYEKLRTLIPAYRNDIDELLQIAREFAKLHVEAALEAAAEKATTIKISWGLGEYDDVDKDSILNAYPLINIK